MKGNQTNKAVWVGQKYTMKMDMSEQYMREPRGRGSAAIAAGRLQLRRGSIAFNNTGFFSVEITPLNRTPFTYNYTAQVLGGGVFSVGALSLETGTMEFPINSKNDEVTIRITNDTPLPSNLMSAEFESMFSIRARRSQA